MNRLEWIAAVTLLTAVSTAHSQSMTYDFRGIGTVCTAQPGADFVCESDVQFTGSITMEVLDPNPGGPDGELDRTWRAWADNGWVQNNFVIRWGDQTYVPGAAPGMQMRRSFTEVWNDFIGLPDDPWRDMLHNSVVYASADDLCVDDAELVRITTDRSWLDGLEFDLSAKLAPGADATNELSFNNIACGATFDHRYARIQLTAMSPHATQAHIDIRPHADPNYINPKSAGLVAVAVLGSTEFDATQVDPQWARFGPRRASPLGEVRVADVNRDGYPDAVLRFRIRDTGIRFGQHIAGLAGRTFAGERFFGVDRIRTPGHR